MRRWARWFPPLVAAAVLVAVGAVLVVSAGGGDARSGGTGSATSGTRAGVPTVDCGSAGGRVKAQRPGRERLVLGLAAVRPPFLGQPTGSGSGRWPLWTAASIALRSGSPPLRVTIPRPWRGRVGISWRDSGIVSVLRVGRCAA